MTRSHLALLIVVVGLVATGALVMLDEVAHETGGVSVTAKEPLLVAAASDLRPAFHELGEGFEAQTGERVVFSFGSSGQLAQQVIEGAPMDLYAAANADFVERVLDAGRGRPQSRSTYAFGRLAIWSPASQGEGWETLEELAADPDAPIVAIANPEHAPYGAAARKALQTAGVWQDVEPRVVFGQSVTDTHRLAATGNADAAVVALSLALADGDTGDWSLVPDELYGPLRQDLVVTTEHPERAELARRFAEYVTSGPGRQTMRRYGFVRDEERLPATERLPEAPED